MIVTKRRLVRELLFIFAKVDKKDIRRIKPIHIGFTNTSFFAKLRNGDKYQVRIGGSNDIVDRRNEHAVITHLKLSEYVYHDPRTGNAVKKWLDGKSGKYPSEADLTAVGVAFRTLHAVKPLLTMRKFDPIEFISNGNDLNEATKTRYLDLVSKYQSEQLVLCHNDVNTDNMVINETGCHFIDWEWSRINHPYWDIANYIKDLKLSEYQSSLLLKQYDKKFDYKKMLDFCFLTACFSYQWTFSMKRSVKIYKYRKYIRKVVRHYYETTSL